MNPLRSLAWRTRTFLSEPVQQAEAESSRRQVETAAKTDELAALVSRVSDETAASARETHLLFVSLRTLLEEQARQTAEQGRQIAEQAERIAEQGERIAELTAELRAARGEQTEPAAS